MKRIFLTISIFCVLGLANVLLAQEVKINSNLAVEADGTVRMDGAATVWDDIRVSLVTRGSGGVNPVFSLMQGTLYAYLFEGTKDNNIYFEVQLPHSYKQGSKIYPHVHWAMNGTTTTDVTWSLDYEWQNINGIFAGAVETISTSVPGSGVVGKQQINNIGADGIDGTGKNISSILMCRLYRNGASDANNDNCFLLAFDIHFEIDTDGSRQALEK